VRYFRGGKEGYKKGCFEVFGENCGVPANKKFWLKIKRIRCKSPTRFFEYKINHEYKMTGWDIQASMSVQKKRRGKE